MHKPTEHLQLKIGDATNMKGSSGKLRKSTMFRKLKTISALTLAFCVTVNGASIGLYPVSPEVAQWIDGHTGVLTAHAAEIGAVVTSDFQVTSEGQQYPKSGSTLVEKEEDGKYAKVYKWSDGTVTVSKGTDTEQTSSGDNFKINSTSLSQGGCETLVITDGVSYVTPLQNYPFKRVVVSDTAGSETYSRAIYIPNFTLCEVLDNQQLGKSKVGLKLSAGLESVKEFYGADATMTITGNFNDATRIHATKFGFMVETITGPLKGKLVGNKDYYINEYGSTRANVSNGGYFYTEITKNLKDLEFENFVLTEPSAGYFASGENGTIMWKSDGAYALVSPYFTKNNATVTINQDNSSKYGTGGMFSGSQFKDAWNTGLDSVTYESLNGGILAVSNTPMAKKTYLNCELTTNSLYGDTLYVGENGTLNGYAYATSLYFNHVFWNSSKQVHNNLRNSATLATFEVSDGASGTLPTFESNSTGYQNLIINDADITGKVPVIGTVDINTGKVRRYFVDKTTKNTLVVNVTKDMEEAEDTALKSVTLGTDLVGSNLEVLGSEFLSKAKIKSFKAPNLKTIGKLAFEGSVISGVLDIGEPEDIGESAFSGVDLQNQTLNLGSVTKLGKQAFYGVKFSTANQEITFKDTEIGVGAFVNSNVKSLKLIDMVNEFNTSMIKGCTNLKSLYLFGTDMDSSSVKSDIPSTTLIYCEEGSSVETWCKNNSLAYKTLTAEEIEEVVKGQMPYLDADSFTFDATEMSNLKFTVGLGVKPAGASTVKKVLIDNQALAQEYFTFNGTNTITVKAEYLKKLSNGAHTFSVVFDNGSFKSGATIFVMNSEVSGNTNEPPEALVTVKYEFYKDYPDYLIIPVKLNGATTIKKLMIGTKLLDEEDYELQDSAVVIRSSVLETLDAGKYRVVPTFNDINNTTISNIQLLVFDSVADRAAPYLLQTRILFDGAPVVMRFSMGAGDLETMGVLALVLDDTMILPDGSTLDYTSGNINKLQKSFKTVMNADDLAGLINDNTASPSEATKVIEEEKTVATPSQASPSEATSQGEDTDELSILGVAVEGISNLFRTFSSLPEEQIQLNTLMLDNFMGNLATSVFTVEDDTITLDGDYVKSLNLTEGDHLIGAIFDNTEKTNDLKKVILSIASKGDNGGNNGGGDNGNGENPSNPGNGGNNGGGNNGNNGGDTDNGGGNGGNSGGSSGGGGGSKGGEPVVTPPTTIDSGSKPSVPNDGGTFTPDPTNPEKVKYTDKDGNPVVDKWVGDGEDWYRTDENSYIRSDWFVDTATSKWYYLSKEQGNKFGAARYGWFFETRDGLWYFLNPLDTAMAVGWVSIDNTYYYFTPVNDGQTYFGDNDNGWYYFNAIGTSPLGSMWAGKTTPDGHTVSESGARVN